MIDLKNSLRSVKNNYRFIRDAAALRLYPMPHNQFTTQPPPLQEMTAIAFLKADKYELSWRISSSGNGSDGLMMGEILLYIGSYTTPALVYDIHNYPEYSIAFEVKDSRNIYVAVNIRSRSIVSIHTLSAHLARDTILEYDPLMFKWNMELVSRALKKQKQFANKLCTLVCIFKWESLKHELKVVKKTWKKVFENSPPFKNNYQSMLLDCYFQSPILLATSRNGILGLLKHDKHYANTWVLQLGSQQLEPTNVHSQYLIWCFPDREIKIALRRDAPIDMPEVRFTLQGNNNKTVISKMPWYWIGYNMIADIPFYNLWSVSTDEFEFINWKDILGILDQIEEHFSCENLFPKMNVYDE